MKPRSAKAKGRRLQNRIVTDIKALLNFDDDDIAVAVMSETGADVKPVSDLAKEAFPYAIEAKNQERLNIWAALEQAERNANGLTPLLVFRRNRGRIYVALAWADFLALL